MANFIILTNNPLAVEKYPLAAQYKDCGSEGIIKAARDLVHTGAQLISHPLAGSLKPNENPYRSIVLSCTGGALDFDSLRIIEGALDRLMAMPPALRSHSKRILHDYMTVDLDLMDSAMASLPPQYHT